MRMIKAIPPVFLILLTSSCSTRAVPNAASDSAAVMTAYEQYRQAWLHGDTAAALARITDGIHILISGVPDIVGKQAARRVFVDEMATYQIPVLTLKHQAIVLGGDYAVVTGTYDEIQVPKTGAPVRGTGRYMTIWRREGNEWRIAQYMLNELPH